EEFVNGSPIFSENHFYTIIRTQFEDGRVITQVYAEAGFYDLSFSAEKEPREFNADTADVPMQSALLGTGWTVGNVTVTTKRTWQCAENNALSILRAVQNIYGGDLVFDSANRQVHRFDPPTLENICLMFQLSHDCSFLRHPS